MEVLDYNCVLNIIEHLHVLDSGRFAATAKRYYYLVHEFRRLHGPEVITVSSWDRKTFQQRPASAVVSQAVQKLQQRPNLVLAFNTTRSTLNEELPRQVPPNTIVLSACAENIQVNLGPQNVESKSNASVMFASLPDADIVPFCFVDLFVQQEMEEFQQQLIYKGKDHWKVVIVYASGIGASIVSDFVDMTQANFPEVAIVGGICDHGYVSNATKRKDELQQMSVRELREFLRTLGGSSDYRVVEKSELVDYVWKHQNSRRGMALQYAADSVFGVVLGGDVPVRTMVSRGVHSITYGTPQPTSPYVVKTARLSRQGDLDFPFRGNDFPPIHLIHDMTHRETGCVVSARELLDLAEDKAKLIGIKRPKEDGFELHMISPFCHNVSAFIIMTNGSEVQGQTYEGAEVDLFYISGEASCQDMDTTVRKLREQTRGEQILGAIMFSCSGRGPQTGDLIQEEMADATRFAKVFPEVPCLGFYAGGEVGPLALAANQNVFRKGKAAVQGFTAVFCLFIVPVVERRNYLLDDSPDAVQSYIRNRLLS